MGGRFIHLVGRLKSLRMRTLLLISLFSLSFGLTALSLLAVRFTLHRQIQRNLKSDLQHSVDTFLNLERQRREMLGRESALLADLPSLKAIMTTQDARTIQDGGRDFWEISGGDLFQLYDQGGRLVASYGPGQMMDGLPDKRPRGDAMRMVIDQPQETRTIALGDSLYEVIAQPISFGPRVGGTLLGYVVLGAAIDQRVAQEVSQAAAAEVAFTIDGKVAVSTLPPLLSQRLNEVALLRDLVPGTVANVTLADEHYLAAAMPLSSASQAGMGHVQLVVLRSYADAAHVLSAINHWLLGLGLLALLLSTLTASSIARRVTWPLEALVDGARALGRGDFRYQLSGGGTAEIRELTQAFDHMRLELEGTQRALLDSERLATIGRMANSISHDLRHYISAMYANAEFLSLASTPQPEREELIYEVQTAVNGMTEMLDSLLGFSQTGRGLMPTYESIPYLVERAASLLRAHPEARLVDLQIGNLLPVEGWVDATKFVRAIFNLLLNACQAARRGAIDPRVTVTLTEDEEYIVVHVLDNGPGVSAAMVSIMFEPFVSEGRENGTGLGLTLARHIAQEHGGRLDLEESSPGRTVFSLRLEKAVLHRLRMEPTVAVVGRNLQHID